MQKATKKKMTIDKLATEMRAGFSGVNKRIDTTVDLIDRLAVSTAKGFENVDKRFEGVDKRFESVATKDDFRSLDRKIEGIKDQLEGTNRRIDHLAETRVSKVTYKELEGRVGIVETKLSVKK
jgi:tetrahydromethanopterin S-methyltransferase subunit G